VSTEEGDVIDLATWVLWVHILAASVWLGAAAAVFIAVLPAPEESRAAAARRAHFLTSRAMEILILTGLLNILTKGIQSSLTLNPGFFAMLSLKMVLVAAMAALQIWMGAAWRRAEVDAARPTRRARIGLSAQCFCGAVAVLLGLGLRAV
jgi:uncharacterized membrane protein